MKERLNKFIDRIKLNYKENKIGFYIVAAIWIIAITTTLIIYRTSLGYDSIGNSEMGNVVELVEGTKVEQILPVQDGTESIALEFATYRRKNKGEIFVTIKGDRTNKTYYSNTFDVNNIEDNTFKVLHLSETLNQEKDKYVVVTITSNSELGTCLGTYYSNIKYDNSLLEINGKRINGTIPFRMLFKEETLSKFNTIALIVIISSLSLLLIWLFLYKPNYEYFFTTFVLVLGLIFMTIITPFSPPDESTHYEYSLQESNRLMFNDDYLDVDKEYIWPVIVRFYRFKINNKDGYRWLLKDFNEVYEYDKKADCFNFDINNAYKFAYAPQAIGLAISRTLGLNKLKVFYSGRLTNLLFYVLCVFICLKNLPKHKTLVGIICSFPMLIQQAASYSYDSFVAGICFVTFGFIMKWIYTDERIKPFDFIIAFLACLIVAPIKYIYGLLSLLYFLVSYNRFGSKTKKVILVLILCSPMLYYLAPMVIERIDYIFRKTLFADDGIEIKKELYSMKYIASHIKESINIVLRTIRYELSAWYYGSIGRYLSQMTLVLPMWTMRIVTIIVIAAALLKEEISLGIFEKAVFFIICVGIALLSIVGMLLSETHIGDQYISGLQGRYYSPLLPYFFICFANKKINIPKKYDKYVISSYIIFIFEVIIFILSYTFVN